MIRRWPDHATTSPFLLLEHTILGLMDSGKPQPTSLRHSCGNGYRRSLSESSHSSGFVLLICYPGWNQRLDIAQQQTQSFITPLSNPTAPLNPFAPDLETNLCFTDYKFISKRVRRCQASADLNPTCLLLVLKCIMQQCSGSRSKSGMGWAESLLQYVLSSSLCWSNSSFEVSVSAHPGVREHKDDFAQSSDIIIKSRRPGINSSRCMSTLKRLSDNVYLKCRISGHHKKGLNFSEVGKPSTIEHNRARIKHDS